MGRFRPVGGGNSMILGVLAQQFGIGGGGGAGSRYWRMYFTGSTSAVRFMAAGDLTMAETGGGGDVIGAGTPSASSERGAFYTAADSFNADLGDTWNSESDLQLPSWLQYDFGSGVSVDIQEIESSAPSGFGENAQMFAGALVQSSDDGTSWSTQWVIPTQAAWTTSEVRTFGTAALPDLFVSDTMRFNNAVASATTTFTAMNFDVDRTDRLVAVAIQSQNTSPLSGVTIGGVSATLAVRSKDAASGTPVVEIWYARPTGTSGDVVVTHGASETGYTRATVWNIGGVAVATPEATARFDDAVSGDMSIVAPSGSVVIAIPCGGFASVNLAGLAETFIVNLTNTGFNGCAQEVVTTGATKTITTSAAEARVAACWAI